MPEFHTVNAKRDGLDSFWEIAQHYQVSYQELKEINRRRGADTSSGYTYEDRTPPFGLNDGDVVLLPKKQPEDKPFGETKQDCKKCELPICVYSKRTCGILAPLERATVRLKDSKAQDEKTTTRTTDANGSVVFRDMQPGSYVVEVNAQGHGPLSHTYKTVPKGTPCHQVFLKRSQDWDITMIPGIMRANQWNVGAVLMEHWFSRAAYTYPNPDDTARVDIPFNDTIVKLIWVKGFERAREVYDDMWEDKLYANSAARGYMESILREKGVPIKGRTVRFGDLSQRVNIIDAGDFYVQSRVVTTVWFGELDGLVAALANFAFHMAVEGDVTFKEHRSSIFGGERDVYEVRIKWVGIYVRDSYDFIGDQLGGLGHWNPTTNTVSKTGSNGSHEVDNATFRDWREANRCGGDFLVFSDIEKRNVSSTWEMEIKQ